VLGSPEFGITWKTIEGPRVIIRITGKEGGAARIAKLTESAYEDTQTKSALEKRVEKVQSTDHVELAAADNASAGAVLGVVFQGRTYALRVIESKTERAKFGTKVTSTGEYKF
jgi:hypothetical protein